MKRPTYPTALREKALALREAGRRSREIAELLGVSEMTVYRWLRLHRERGALFNGVTERGAYFAPDMHFDGQKMKRLREQAGMSQSALAAALRLSNADSIRRYEHGEAEPSASTLLRMMVVLRCRPHEIRSLARKPQSQD